MILPRQITRSLLAFLFTCGLAGSAFAQSSSPSFSQIVVFGDSLSDTGNVRARTNAKSGGTVDYPSHSFNFSNGRFTNDDATDPSSATYTGLWHEQLARTFLNLPAATYSLGGGTNYAFGAATTNDGTSEVAVVSTPSGDTAITIDHMGKQLDDYLAGHVVDPDALYVLWGGVNDLLQDDSARSVTATAARVAALFSRLAHAGARSIMVPNVPAIGVAPVVSGDAARVKTLSAAIASYRSQLSADLISAQNTLSSQGITLTLYPVDEWANTIRIYSDPGNTGFTDVANSAQGNSAANPDHFFYWDGLHPTTAGHYRIAQAAYDALSVPFTPPARVLNIATRVFVDTGERISIAGFIVTGDVAKKVLIRGIGPSLASSGVPDRLANPTLALFDNNQTQLQSNDDWKTSPDAVKIMGTGLAPSDDLESAIIATLPPGQYTAQLAGKDNTTGNGVVEVYDIEPGTDSVLANLSTRGFVGTGDNVMIGGVIIASGDSPIMVFRAIGPSLASMGILEPLMDPAISLRDVNGAEIAFNDDWKQLQIQAVRATNLAPTDERESVIVHAFLSPGNYTAIVRGKNDTTGVAVVEAYRIP